MSKRPTIFHLVIPNVDIFINSEKINKVYETKFFGVIIQHNVKWHAHSYLIKNKISNTIVIMNKVKHILSTSHFLQLLYQTLIEPYQSWPIALPLPPVGHIWDVMLVWRMENINKNCLCVTVLCTIIMVHKDTSSAYRSVDCIELWSCSVSLSVFQAPLRLQS